MNLTKERHWLYMEAAGGYSMEQGWIHDAEMHRCPRHNHHHWKVKKGAEQVDVLGIKEGP